MSDAPDNLMLMLLRRIDANVDRVIDDMGDLKVRMTSVEEGLAGVNRRLDRLDVRVDRIERRLDLVDAAGQ
jgi:archaellum component FlaC